MRWLFHPLLLLIARSTESELAKQVEYLKAENAILRKRIKKRVMLKEEEKRLLVKLGQAVGKGVVALLTVCAYPTYRRWVGLYAPDQAGTPCRPAKGPGGRPRTPDAVRDLVLRLARENDWGYTRILGELKKLGINKISRTTVVNILRENDLDPKTDPRKGMWGEFFKAHAQTLWQCDFFSKHIVTATGIRQCFILAFVHVATRRVYLSPCSFKPDAAWMQVQARAFLDHAQTQNLSAAQVLRDRDAKYENGFDAALEAGGCEVRKVSIRAPNMNAYVERFVQAIQQECLDKFIVFGREHLDHVISEYAQHYHTERPHQAMNNLPLMPVERSPATGTGEVVCTQRLGGLLRHYHRSAA